MTYFRYRRPRFAAKVADLCNRSPRSPIKPEAEDPLIGDCQINAYNFETIVGSPPARFAAIRFDPNNTCNLHCVYCHNHRSDWYVDIDAFRQFLDTKVRSVDHFQVGCVMEPTLDHRLVDIIHMIGKSRARPLHSFMLQTNGLLLHRHDHARMVDAGLTNLSVSLDVADPQMQRELRGGMSMAKLLRNLEAFRQAAPSIPIELISVVTSSNVGQMQGLVELAIGLGAWRVVFRELLYYPESDVVDHQRMGNLLLGLGDFDAMANDIRSRYSGRIEMIFASNTELSASAIRMIKDSQRTPSITPRFHR
jgi:molybdenum cofactor biosynthesis enzyme MoaA